MAYCIFNLLLGTPPRLFEPSLLTTADAATRNSSKFLIVADAAAPAALTPRLQPAQGRAGAASSDPARRRGPQRSAREAALRLRGLAPAQKAEGSTDLFGRPDPPS